jgi:hypothetical protein
MGVATSERGNLYQIGSIVTQNLQENCLPIVLDICLGAPGTNQYACSNPIDEFSIRHSRHVLLIWLDFEHFGDWKRKYWEIGEILFWKNEIITFE